MSKIFRDSFANRPKSKGEINSGKKFVEIAGYVSPQRRIADLINAGVRLEQSRKEAYDTVAEYDPEVNPTRRPDFDRVDAFMMSKQVKSRLKAQKADADKKKAVPVPVSPSQVQPDLPAKAG